MAFLKIDSGPIEATDKLRDVPKEKWRELMLARRLHMKTKLGYDCSCLVEFVDDAQKMFSSLGFSSAELMIRDGYNLVPEEIDVAVRWLRLNPPRHPLPLDAAIKLGKKGQYGKGRPKNRGARELLRGDNNAYWFARLDRDYPGACSIEADAIDVATKLGIRKIRLKRCPKCGHEW